MCAAIKTMRIFRTRTKFNIEFVHRESYVIVKIYPIKNTEVTDNPI